ncbi:MAG TPA: hypothetical protein PK033_16005, partial [Acetivibrio sp.]|nr:hypothetical protein [Acetivibrio sp.]
PAGALIVGPVMRPVTDKLKISREKLSYLVDSTSAPVTGIAVVSSWLEPLGLMSWADYLNLTFKGTCQWVFSFFSENRRSRKQINLYIMAIPFNLISCTYTAVNADPLFPA